jgi:hypothetical protein
VATKEPYKHSTVFTDKFATLTPPLDIHSFFFLRSKDARVYLDTLAIVFPFSRELCVWRKASSDIHNITSDHAEHGIQRCADSQRYRFGKAFETNI